MAAAEPGDRVGEVVERGLVTGPLHEGEAELERALADRPHRGSWHRADAPGAWQAGTESGEKFAVIRTVAGDYEARVYRFPTGPSPGPEPELAHGPQVFPRPEEALQYAEAQLGW
jgi:hypothetical protein